MSKMRNVLVLLLVVLLAVIAIKLFAEQTAGEPDFSMQKSEAQTVLYTVYRGPYEKVVKPIGELYALAAQKKIIPRGAISLVYLNNPYYTSQDNSGKHCLTEIRIPVSEEAMQQAVTLGEMTDVKKLRSIEVAVMKKQIEQKDYEAFFGKLYEQIAKKGYRPADNAIEIFKGDAMGGDYSRMKSEIMIPVVKIEQGRK